MKRKGLLPRLALNSLWRNSSTYLPYIGISIFSIFTFFVFDLIIRNDVMSTLPRAAYAKLLMSIGFVLLAIIMVPFLYYTNSFLIKRRKKELGLYSILGMEKKHIGIMMLIETLLIYAAVVISAIILGLLFSKAVFLLLLNLTKLPVNAAFSISGKAICDTFIFYALISGINLLANLVQVGKANPTELMSEAKSGEKEPKHIIIWTSAGILLLGYGYYLAVTSKVNSGIFLNFFLAVLLVVIGTHFLFTSGSIAILKGLKKNKKFYYHSEHFVATSGMLYRMKKNAAGLVNICIFATMVIITTICTVSLYLGIPRIQSFMYPYDISMKFFDNSFSKQESWREELERLSQADEVTLEDYYGYDNMELKIVKQGDHFLADDVNVPYKDRYKVCLLTLDTYQKLEAVSYVLAEDEVLIYSTGPDYGKDKIVFLNDTYRVKEELKNCILEPKAAGNIYSAMYYVIVPNRSALVEITKEYGAEPSEDMVYTVKMNIQGNQEQKQSFSKDLVQLASKQPGFSSSADYSGDRKDMEAMYGGLLFIGIFFGLIFLLCLLIIMYYKQITEGFEDQKNFEIMQKVGMSDLEVKRTIKRQILQVFFIPLAGAIIHTIIGMFMVINLMAVLYFFQIALILTCSAGVCAGFSIIYGICYNRTARTYYRIVRSQYE